MNEFELPDGMARRDRKWPLPRLLLTYLALCVVLLVAAGTVAVARAVVPVWGAAVSIVLAAMIAAPWLARWIAGDETRLRKVKTTLDALWGVWVVIATATVFTSAMLSGEPAARMDALLAAAPAGWLTALFTATVATAAARLSVALVELWSWLGESRGLRRCRLLLAPRR